MFCIINITFERAYYMNEQLAIYNYLHYCASYLPSRSQATLPSGTRSDTTSNKKALRVTALRVQPSSWNCVL